jgi:hypothetical protein
VVGWFGTKVANEIPRLRIDLSFCHLRNSIIFRIHISLNIGNFKNGFSFLAVAENSLKRAKI